MIQLLHTPEGVRDYYNNENARKLNVCRQIRQVFSSYGYQEIQTPAFEYFDIFNAERGSVASRDMYKLFDRDGETLVLRPDFTPAIARCAAKYFATETLPVRLSYLGDTYVNNNSLRGQLKESMQAGIELVGDSSVDANAEVIALVISTLKKIGLERFQIEIGDVRYFRGFLQEAGIGDDVRSELRTCIENKNHFGLEEVLEKHGIQGSLSQVLARLPHMFGNPEQILSEARSFATNPDSLEAVERMEELYRKLEACGFSRYITFDLGMLGSHDYYTGMIFKGYTYGTGESIVGGGRYDGLLAQFGKDAPSVGFGIQVDVLLQAMSRQGIVMEGRPDETLIVYSPESYITAVQTAEEYRNIGVPAVLIRADGRELDSYLDYCIENHVTRVLTVDENKMIREFLPSEKLGKILPVSK